MGVLDRLMRPDLHASSPGPLDDHWYRPLSPGGAAASGEWVDSESARKVSAWYRGREILASSVAMLPLQVYERLSNGSGSNQARFHPLYDILHDQPNGWQDSFSWRTQGMYHLIDHGNAYNFIVSGPRGFVEELHPIDPTTVRPEQLANKRVVYHVRQKSGTTTTYSQDQIFHLRGPSDDGVVGKGVLAYARDSVGIALATEGYAGRLFSQGALHGGVISVPGLLNDEAAKRMAQSFVTSRTQWHSPKVLEQGATYEESKLTPEDAQMLLSRKFSIDDMARWLGLPRHMLENSDPSFGNAEQFNQNFVDYSLGKWLSLWEFGCNAQLVTSPQRFFVEFTRDALVRGDIAARWNAHVAAVNAGIKSVDEVRAVENLNKRGGKADELREPQNITGKPIASPSQAPRDRSGENAKAAAIVHESAARVLRKETLSAQKAAVKFAADAEGWAAWVREFYASHATLVMQTMLVDEPTAQGYCAIQAADLLAGGLAAVEAWTPDYLASLALRPEAGQ